MKKTLLKLMMVFALFFMEFTTNANVITDENAKTGTSDWLLTNPSPGAMGGRSHEIEGYCSKMSASAGETIDVFVSTSLNSQYTADIYRLGYYGGTGARLMASFGPIQGASQPMPTKPYDNLYECNWDVGFQVTIGADWVSVVYVGKLTELTNGYESFVIFIVKDNRNCDLIYKTSDMNWAAYSTWGGGSLYEGTSQGNYSFNVEVSYDRPFVTTTMYPMYSSEAAYAIGTGEFLIFEWPLVYMLEKQGYDISYLSCIDVHNDGAGLMRTKGLLCAGHDEYWSQSMYDNVLNAINNGMGFCSFSGNATFCAVDLMASRSTGQADRVIERANLFAHPNEILGADSPTTGEGGNCYGDFVCTAPTHWVYENTGMQYGDKIHDLIGWEVHKGPYKNVPSLEVWSEAGVNWGTYACTAYEGDHGNTVVSTSTIWWASHMGPAPGHVCHGSYDAAIDGPFPADPRVNQMTYNICDKIIGDVTPDTIPPSVPAGVNATNIGKNTFTLNWSASTDDIGVKLYEVFQSGISLGTTSSTAMNITGLSCENTYSMSVRASDYSDNWSEESTSENVTTSLCSSDTTYSLVISATNGSVTKSPDMVDYDEGSLVTLTAVPATGYKFDGWSGDAIGTDNPLSLTMDENKNITANFSLNGPPSGDELANWDFAGNDGAITSPVDYAATGVTVSSVSSGSGLSALTYQGDGYVAEGLSATTLADAITGNDYFSFSIAPEAGNNITVTSILIRPVSQNQSRTFALLSSVDGFTSTNVIGSFDFSGNLGGDLNEITVSSVTNETSAVEFRIYVYGVDNPWEAVGMGEWTGLDLVVNGSVGTGGTTSYTLSATGTNGSVTVSPDQADYAEGASVSLSPVPNAGYQFDNWSGDATGSANPLSIIMDENKSITANFSLIPTYSLTLSATNGTISKNPDLTDYSENSIVGLTATPASGYRFDGWSGDASGNSNPLSIIMDADKSITANFSEVLGLTYSLTVVSDNGLVTKNPNQTDYAQDDDVILTATPTTGYQFDNWSGDASGTENPLTITMDADKTVTANYSLIPTYSLNIVSANGTITKSPDQTAYMDGEIVSLTITPATGYQFDGWSGDASGTDNPLSMTMDGDKNITAMFSLIPTYSLIITSINGAVTKSPDLLNYQEGATVYLSATPSAGFQFDGWSGDASGTANPLSISMDENKSITAEFSALPPITYMLDVVAVNGGVTKDPDLPVYNAGTQVTLTATPDAEYQFDNWSGDLSGNSSPVIIMMNEDKSVAANFVFVDDEAPTVPTTLASSAITMTSFTLSWIASTDNVAVTEYEVFNGGVSLGSTSATQMDITSMICGTDYVMTVRAKDPSNNYSAQSAELTVTTEECDEDAPTVPTGLISSLITPTGFTVSWDASNDNIGVNEYEVFVNGVSQGTTANTTMKIMGLFSGMTYDVTISAGDASGNWSAQSTALEVATPLGVSVVNSLQVNQIEVFPNPATNQVGVNLTMVKSSEVSIALVDIQGKQVLKKNYYLDSGLHILELDINDLQSGLYFISIQSENKTKRIKLLVLD